MSKITIVTPCFNAEQYIEETFCSVINQTAILSKRAELEYIICDGNSTDSTLDIIQKYRNSSVKIISEPDSGMYSALAKGLKLASGDIVAYINAGDYYNKYAFDIVLDIFEAKGTSWLTGYNFQYNEKSYITNVFLPFKYRQRFFACGFYCTVFPCVQQESTFWSSSLNSAIDRDYLSNLKYAGDFFLWLQFSKVCSLEIVQAYLGGFKIHKGQLSSNSDAYLKEVRDLIASPNIGDYLLAAFDRILWLAPPRVKKAANRKEFFRFSHQLQEWE